MPTVLDRELERVIERRLTPAPAPARRVAAPPVRFSPLIADPSPAARRMRRVLLWVSVATHIALAVVVMLMPRRAQTVDVPSLPVEIVFTAPIPAVPEMTRPPMPKKAVPKPAPKPEPKPVPREVPKPPVEAEKPAPKPASPVIEPAPIAKVEPKPRPAVRTGLLDEVPTGPAIVASRSSRSPIVASGFDSGAAAATSRSVPGRVTEVGFESGPARSKRSGTGGTGVKESGFGVAAAPAPIKPAPERPRLTLDTEVEILSKPKPVYTEEARALRLEGDVVLDVTFGAGGVVRVLGVAQGLGHGLDEAAIEAARKIQFNPARRDGAPVDHTAKLRVVFRLA